MAPCAHVLPPRIQIPEIVITNTLTITNLDRETFLPENLAELRNHFEQHGKIYKFLPIKSFNRILVIFYQTNDAKTAKTYCNRVKFLRNNIRIYYGQHTPIYDNNDNSSRHLNVPKLEKNWLVSPPSSPPVGWTQIREDRPNSNILADDLVHALARTSLSNNNNIPGYCKDHNDISELSLDDNMDQNNARMQTLPILTVVSCDSDSSQSDTNVPLILVQDWDNSGSQDVEQTRSPKLNFNLQQATQFYPTPRPPLIMS